MGPQVESGPVSQFSIITRRCRYLHAIHSLLRFEESTTGEARVRPVYNLAQIFCSERR